MLEKITFDSSILSFNVYNKDGLIRKKINLYEAIRILEKNEGIKND